MASSSTLEKVPGWAAALLAEARVGHLGLLDGDGRPRVMPVTYAVFEGAAWSAIDHKPKRTTGPETARVRWLRRRPESALTVDLYHDDWDRLAWVQLLGRIDVLEAGEHPTAVDALARRYPQYTGRRPEGPLLRLEVRRALHWRAA